jgi:alkylhydroperoxidase family enzyme
MRLPYITERATFENAKHQAFFDRLIKNRGIVGLTPLDGALLHSPGIARGFLQFFTAVRNANSLPEDVMELAMCRVGALNKAAFEWMHHAPLLHKAGVSIEGVETVRTAGVEKVGRDGEGGLSEKQWRVMRYTDEMTTKIKVTDETFKAVRDVLDSDQQMVDLSKSTSYTVEKIQWRICVLASPRAKVTTVLMILIIFIIDY